jgi:hypothetical protein
MAEIAHLNSGNLPPADRDWIMVERQASGTCLVHICFVTTGEPPRHEGPFRYLSDALDLAQRSAMKMGHDTIFVTGVTNAQRS